MKFLRAWFFFLLIFPSLNTIGAVAWAADENTFVRAQGSKLMVGNKEFFGKGADYIGGRYITEFTAAGEPGGYEIVNNWEFLYNFNATAIEGELKYLKTQLGINVIRLATPCQSDWDPWFGSDSWFQSDGSISSVYLGRLRTLLAIAKKYGIRVQLALLWNVKAEVVNPGLGPGSAQELFYKNYLFSVVAAVKNDPTIMSYEIGNEDLVEGGSELPMLSFLRRMITYVRSLDGNHLIASGEVTRVATSPWFPAAEFGVIADVDNLNGGQPYTLASLVDYIGSHMYGDTTTDLNFYAQAIRASTSKPILLGESGYMEAVPTCPWNQTQIAGSQLTVIQHLVDAVNNQGLNGTMVWAPFPFFTLTPGQFSLMDVPPELRWPGECPYADIPGPPHRKLRGVFPATWPVFSSADLTPLPAAGALKQAYMNKMLNDSQIVSISAVPPSVTAGVPFQVTVTMRNTGTRPWITTGDAQTTYQLIDHQWAVDPAHVVWSIGGEPLPFSPVPPGQEVTFDLTVTAPTVPGTYPFALQMIQQGTEFFGDITPTVSVAVQASSASIQTPDLSGINGKTFPRNATLSLNYDGPITGFNWEVEALDAQTAPVQSHRAGAIAQIATSIPRLDLTQVNLALGRYQVRVRAVNGSQTSDWATATITLVSADLASVRVYPNPFRSTRGDQTITFDQMPANSTVKIFTVSGRWVKTLQAPAGSVSWDLTNDSRDKVASGLYLYVITDGQGNKTRGKLTVIR